MTANEGLLGKVASEGTELELGSGLNFKNGLTARRNASTGMIDVEGTGVDGGGDSDPEGVDLATTGNITLSGLQTIDGVLTTANMRVLVWQQNAAKDNGVYVVPASGAWVRAGDWDATDELRPGVPFTIASGTAHGKRVAYLLTTDAVLGTDGLEFAVSDRMPTNADTGKVQVADAGSSNWIGGSSPKQVLRWNAAGTASEFGKVDLAAAAAVEAVGASEEAAFKIVSGAPVFTLDKSGVGYREPRCAVRVKSTGNVNISSAPANIDGVGLAAGNSILLGSQTTQSENGVYLFVSAGSALTRVTAIESCYAVGFGMHVFVKEGTAGTATHWRITSAFAVRQAPECGLSPIVVDLEDFWLAADTINDWSPAFHRAMAAMQVNGITGTIRAVRRGQYIFATPLLVSRAIIFESLGNWLGGGINLTFTKAGFLVTSTPFNGTNVSSGGTTFRNCLFVGAGSGTAAQHNGIETSQQIHFDNCSLTTFPGHGVVLRGKTSDDVGTLAATTAGPSWTVPAVGGTVSVQFVSTSPLRVGTVMRIATAGVYRVESITDATNAVLYNYGFAYDTAITSKNAAPGTLITTGKACTGVLSNVDHSGCMLLRITSTGLSGFWIEGDNANQGNFFGLDCSSCGARNVMFDNYGLREDSFLGNNYYGFHGATNINQPAASTTTTASYVQPRTTYAPAANGLRVVNVQVASSAGFLEGELVLIPDRGYYRVGTLAGGIAGVPDATHLNLICVEQLSDGVTTYSTGVTVTSGRSVIRNPALSIICTNSNSRAAFYGGYNENSDRSAVTSLVRIDAGRMGVLTPSSNTSPLGTAGHMASAVLEFGTAGDYGVRFQAGGNVGSEETWRMWVEASDANGYTQRWHNSSNTYELVHNDNSALRAWFLTGASHARGGGFLGSARFLVNGGRLNNFTEFGGSAPPPATSTAADFYQVGDWAAINAGVGPFGVRVTAKDGSNNLTWEYLQTLFNAPNTALGDADQTIAVSGGYRREVAAAVLTTGRTVTLGTTGARQSVCILLGSRDVSTNTLTITNGGAGGGSVSLPGNCWQVWQYDGTNWILLMSGTYAPIAVRNQDLAFSAALAATTSETKTVTVTGAAVGDTLAWNARAALPDGVTAQAWVSATNTVSIKAYNMTGSAVDLSGARWDITVRKG